ncbi:DUF397 domain-containing protein [Spirillospora sp. NPDC050679]
MNGPVWRKSSRSAEGTNCVEVADLGEVVGLRDSKCPERGHLVIERDALAVLVGRLKES